MTEDKTSKYSSLVRVDHFKVVTLQVNGGTNVLQNPLKSAGFINYFIGSSVSWFSFLPLFSLSGDHILLINLTNGACTLSYLPLHILPPLGMVYSNPI